MGTTRTLLTKWIGSLSYAKQRLLSGGVLFNDSFIEHSRPGYSYSEHRTLYRGQKDMIKIEGCMKGGSKGGVNERSSLLNHIDARDTSTFQRYIREKMI